MLVRPFVIGAMTALAAACTGDSPESRADHFSPPAGSLPDVYQGVFPCENCPGIESALWLRSDGTFFWRQHYLGDESGAASTAHNLGRWHVEPDGVLVLRGSGPARRFAVTSADELLMLTPSTLEHRLSRNTGAPAFTDRVRIEGMASVGEHGPMLAECLTGLAAGAGGSELRPFLRQYRSLGFRGEPLLVEVEARFVWSDGGDLQSFTVERVIATKLDRTC